MIWVFGLLTLLLLFFACYGVMSVFMEFFDLDSIVTNVIAGAIVFIVLVGGWFFTADQLGAFAS